MTIATSDKLPLNWPVILFMAGVHIGAVVALFPQFFSWRAVGLCLFMYWVTGCLGVTLGLHRLVSHRSFQVPKWLEYFLVFCGSLACQGGPIEWIGLHRHHHLYSDQDNDHHNSGRGFWWSHMAWMFHDVPAKQELGRFTKDIGNDPVYLFLENYFLGVQFALAVLFYFLGGWPFVFWGIFARLVLVYHVTWFVNSATHLFGYRSHESGDRSTNCWWVALLAFGEGWHNNHHAYQYSARHGLRWWEFDLTWTIIRFLKMLGLATNVKIAEQK
ncbi:MAG: fatty acid desaturase [Leptolyngbyaceae cyanobacterium bins.59]|nr:fatty acid desaturase [Leptolyngbyaceae cyanobacterium bins.59]